MRNFYISDIVQAEIVCKIKIHKIERKKKYEKNLWTEAEGGHLPTVSRADNEYEEANLDDFMIRAASVLTEENNPDIETIIDSLNQPIQHHQMHQ